MRNTFKLVLSFAIVTMGLAACTKEKQIENRLEKGSGKWNIRTLNYTQRSSTGGVSQKDYLDAGSFEFNKNGTIVKILDYDQTKTTMTGNWSNDENVIHATWSDGSATVFTITKNPKKGKAEIYESNTETYSNGWGGPGSTSSIEHQYTYSLERAD